jgi:hypothetical protein
MSSKKISSIDENVKVRIVQFQKLFASLSKTASWASKEFSVKLTSNDVRKILKQVKLPKKVQNQKKRPSELVAFHKDLELLSSTMLDKMDIIGLAERLRQSRRYRSEKTVQALEFSREWWRDFQATANIGRPEFTIPVTDPGPEPEELSREEFLRKIYDELIRDPFKYSR